MKNFKKRLLCLLLCVCMCSSLTFFANAVEPLDGPINADDNAQLIVAPTVETSTTPAGAVAAAYNYSSDSSFFYRVNGNVMSLNPGVTTFTSPGWMPETVSTNNVIVRDDRDLVDEDSILMYPHRAIAMVETTWMVNGRLKTFNATATMISPNVAITAAHVIYDARYGGWPISVRVIPAKNSLQDEGIPAEPFGYSFAQEVAVSIPYFETSSVDGYHDWGLIHLATNIGNTCGYLGYRFDASSLVTQDGDPECLMSGYPADLNGHDGSENGSYLTYNQYYAVESIVGDIYGQTTCSNGTTYQYRTLYYRIDTYDGMSGSAVLYSDFSATGGVVIVGVHSANENSARNRGAGITSQLYSFMLAYTSAHNP